MLKVLEVQKFLRERGDLALEDLKTDYFIKIVEHPDEPLVILNYSMVDSPKKHPIVRECRGLILEKKSWDVIARSFPRFYNLGESPEEEKRFDWANSVAEDKEDGSLILLWNYRGKWMVSTRGSFAAGEVQPGCGTTWGLLFWESLGHPIHCFKDKLKPDHTYCFELCSQLNKVVRDYHVPRLFLLTAFQNQTGSEENENVLDNLASEQMAVSRPKRFYNTSRKDLVDLIEDEKATYEGLVVRDRTGLRIKIKNPSYVALHQLKGNGQGFSPKHLVPLILKGEVDEVLSYFPEALPAVLDVAEKMAAAHLRMMMVWQLANGKALQKTFAELVTKHTPMSCILFEARKRGVEPNKVWLESADVIIKRLFG